MRRISYVAALAVALAAAETALAHGPAGHQPGYVSTVTEIRPLVPGLTATVIGGDRLLSVRNWSNRTVVVLGPDRRPLYRLGRDGVSKRVGDRWRLVKPGTSVTWHDSRIHWPGADPPPVVAQAPAERHKIADWRVPAVVNGSDVVIHGSLGWVPDPAASSSGIGGVDTTTALAVVALGGIVALAVVAFAAERRRPRSS